MNVITNSNIQSTLGLAALESVLDPEIGLNVVDLGLIYQLNFNSKDLVLTCTMTLTTQFCPMGESITDGVKQALQKTFRDHAVNIVLTFEPAWDHERISEAGKSFLNQ